MLGPPEEVVEDGNVVAVATATHCGAAHASQVVEVSWHCWPDGQAGQAGTATFEQSMQARFAIVKKSRWRFSIARHSSFTSTYQH
jgi:hypothetical protein